MMSEKSKKNGEFEKIINIMCKLRSEDGCPWDREQTHTSLKPYLIEECAEFLDEVDEKSSEGMKEELGDLILHVAFHSVIAEENGEFTYSDVLKSCSEKLLRRHPHVFGDKSMVDNAEQVKDIWHAVKRHEKAKKNIHNRTKSILDGIPKHCPSLLRAEKIQKRAAYYGFDWKKQDEIIEKINEEMRELKDELEKGDESAFDEELGDLLFTLVNLARFRNRGSSEELLAKAAKKFVNRFKYIENELERSNIPVETGKMELMEKLWNESKKKLK